MRCGFARAGVCSRSVPGRLFAPKPALFRGRARGKGSKAPWAALGSVGGTIKRMLSHRKALASGVWQCPGDAGPAAERAGPLPSEALPASVPLPARGQAFAGLGSAQNAVVFF